MGKEILKSVAVAVIVAAILGIASKFSGTTVIRWLGGATQEDVQKAIQNREVVAFMTRDGRFWSVDRSTGQFRLSPQVANNPQSYEQVIIIHEDAWENPPATP